MFTHYVDRNESQMSFRELISVDPTGHRREAETGDLEHNCRRQCQRTWAALPLLSADSMSRSMQHAGFYTIGDKTECETRDDLPGRRPRPSESPIIAACTDAGNHDSRCHRLSPLLYHLGNGHQCPPSRSIILAHRSIINTDTELSSPRTLAVSACRTRKVPQPG